MRLLIVGAPSGPLAAAAKLAEESDADVRYAEAVADALALLSAGCRADLVVVEAALGIRDLVNGVSAHTSRLPVIACGEADRRAAVEAIEAGAREYLPLPATAEAVAALIVALAHDPRDVLRAETIWNMR